MAKSRKYTIMLPSTVYETIDSEANKEGRSMSDLVREAVKHYMEKKGLTLDFSVDRGGYRGGPKDKREVSQE